MISKQTIDEQVSFTVNAKELKGILSHPVTAAPYPAIILLHGSDRSSVQDPYYTAHAENLVQSGFAVLRYDGPGWGGAAPNGAGFETLEYRTTEARAALQYLQSRSDINPDGIGLWGISQGGWICQMAAAQDDRVAFIIPVSGPGVTPAEQEVYRVEAESKAAGCTDEEIAKAVLIRRAMVDIVLDEPMYQEVNRSESQRLGEGPCREMVELTYSSNPVAPEIELGKIIAIMHTIKDEAWTKSLHLDQVLPMFTSLPPHAWGMAKAQMRAVMVVNPADFLTKVRCPVLAIFGEADTSIPVDQSVGRYQQYLGAAGNEAVTIKVFPNASHTIRVGENFTAGYFELMVDWLQRLPLKASLG